MSDEYSEWDTDYILSECREIMTLSADRGGLVDELAKRIERLAGEVEAVALLKDDYAFAADCLNEMLNQSPWVSVDERLPEDDDFPVLVRSTSGALIIAESVEEEYHSKRPVWIEYNQMDWDSKLWPNWMPIPALPETTDLLDNAIGGVAEFPSVGSKENV